MEVEIEIKILMKKKFKDKIEWFSNNYDKEIAGWITGSIDGENIILEDLLIPEQEADSGSVDMEGKAVIKLRKEYGKRCEKIIGEWHSHHNMGTFWSATDDSFIEQFSEPREICVFIVSSKEEHKVRVEVRKPFKISIDELDYEVEEEIDDKLAKKLQKEIDKKIKEPIKTAVSYGCKDYGYSYGNYGNQRNQTLFNNKKEHNLQVGKMVKFYNGINKITISDIPSYYAEVFITEFNFLSPKIFDSKFGEDSTIEITFKNKKEAVDEMKDIRNFLINMLQELEDITQTYLT